jgi:hypothetical protein
MKLELRKFDITKVKDDKVIVMIGKRGTGKSFLIQDLLFYHQDIPIGTVISPTEPANKFFANFVPNVFIHEEYKGDIIEKYVKRQRLAVDKVNQEKALYGQTRLDPRAFLILDDCLYDNTWTKDRNIRFIFQNGRHVKCMFLFSMQYPLGVPPNLRTNIDYVFILRENIVQNRKRIYDNYAGMFPSFDIFCQCMNQTTENFECLVIDNTAKSNRLEDVVFWYKAEDHGGFRLGAPQFWINNNTIGSRNSAEEEEEFDPNVGKSKSRHIINIKKIY